MIQELQNFRSKYPDYGDMSDLELAKKLADKYPEDYGDLLGKVQGSTQLTQQTQQTQQTQEPSGQSGALETVKNIGKVYPVLETAANLATGAVAAPIAGLSGLGQLVLGRGLPQAAKSIEEIQGALTYQPKTEGGKQLTEAAMVPSNLLNSAAQAVADPIASAGYPNVAATVETAIEAAPLFLTPGAVRSASRMAPGLKQAANTLIEEAKGAPGKIKSVVRPYVPLTDLKPIVAKAIDKAVKPGVRGRKTAPAVQAYNEKAFTAVKKIVENKKNLSFLDDSGSTVGRLPESLNEFQKAIAQTKASVFKDFDARAGSSAIPISGLEAIRDILPILEDKAISTVSPHTANYVKTRMKHFQNKEFTATEAQRAVQVLNMSQDSFFSTPSVATYGRSLVDSAIANNLRKQLDKAVSGTSGPGYLTLRREYGALKAIETDVAKAANRERNKVSHTLLPNFTDIFAGHQIIHGLASLNSGSLASGAFVETVSAIRKAVNNPNRRIKNMFKTVDKHMNRRP
jgi:hypothetical protein